MRVIFITDIHGNYDKFMNLLEVNEYDESKDTLILGGDYFDRGKQSKEVAQWLVDNYKKPNIHLIRGNHDDFMVDLFAGNHLMYKFNYKYNGLKDTIQSFISPDYFYDPSRAASVIRSKFPELPEVFDSMIDYIEFGDIIYTHGSLPLNYDSTATEKDWEEARWGSSEKFAQDNKFDKLIAIGHWSVQHIHPQYTNYDEPAYIRNVIFCDSGLATGSTEGFAFISELSKD